MPTIADLLAEQSTDRRGLCPKCKREEKVPINEDGICFPCHIQKPGLACGRKQPFCLSQLRRSWRSEDRLCIRCTNLHGFIVTEHGLVCAKCWGDIKLYGRGKS